MASIQSRLCAFLYRRIDLFNGYKKDPVRLRARLDHLAGWSPPHRRVRVTPVMLNTVSAEWLIPPGAPDDRAVLYIHGGAWFLGSIVSHRAFISRLAFYNGTKTLAINYRLAPEHPFPAGLDDCLTAYRRLVDGGVHPNKIIVAGDSAGGNLTLALLLALRDRGSPLPAAAVCLSPATDLTGSGASHQSHAALDPVFCGHRTNAVVRWYAGGNDPALPLLSPYFADLHGLPPLLIHVGDHEILLDDSTRFAAKARAAGVDVSLVVWPEMFHVFHVFDPFLPEARRANREIAAFIRRRLGESKAQ